MLTKLQRINPHISILPLTAPEFLPYGKVHDHVQTPLMLAFLEKQSMPPEEHYTPCSSVLMDCPEAELFTRYLFAQVPCQIGYYLSMNTKLNALEYHKCSEVLSLATDVVLLVGKVEDIHDSTYDSANLKAFYAPAGTVVELYAAILHFAPCMVSHAAGVRQIVAQSYSTNTPLDFPIENKSGENLLLLEKNKWVLAHAECTQLIAQGAHAGLIGENVEITPL